MPSRASYEFKVEGLLDGPPTANTSAIEEFWRVFPRTPPVGSGGLGSSAGWVEGFILTEYGACLWKADGYDVYEPPRTLLSFRAEISIFLPGVLYEPPIQNRLLKDVEWFYKYKAQAWHIDLSDRVHQLNQQLLKIATVLEPVRFREWKWYCGNGGGE